MDLKEKSDKRQKQKSAQRKRDHYDKDKKAKEHQKYYNTDKRAKLYQKQKQDLKSYDPDLEKARKYDKE